MIIPATWCIQPKTISTWWYGLLTTTTWRPRPWPLNPSWHLLMVFMHTSISGLTMSVKDKLHQKGSWDQVNLNVNHIINHTINHHNFNEVRIIELRNGTQGTAKRPLSRSRTNFNPGGILPVWSGQSGSFWGFVSSLVFLFLSFLLQNNELANFIL